MMYLAARDRGCDDAIGRLFPRGVKVQCRLIPLSSERFFNSFLANRDREPDDASARAPHPKGPTSFMVLAGGLINACNYREGIR